LSAILISESGCIYCLFHSLYQLTPLHTAAREGHDENEDDNDRVSTWQRVD